ncbi:glycine zipper 2TM protein [Luteimonas cucumeris]|uniref:Glycine zipper 2TM protein n=1 Tax=Luteimonas cucumeris TaxID=985012 RepID=A0A562KY10_9GAMM|nr:glycine zipper 2TM domain-containing protein [Luteimonas cucumeris]TWI00273.1 glycine zipper 2TM protein [Luteimonas cucumeris]
MKRLATSVLAFGLVAAFGTAAAQSSGYSSRYGQPVVDRYGQSSGDYYDYARVIRVDPVIQSGYRNTNSYSSGTQRCYTRNDGYVSNDGYYDRDGYYRDDGAYRSNGYYGNDGAYRGGSDTSRTVATVVGGVIGAVVGSQVGGGSARYASSAIGSMVGGLAGRSIYDQSVRQRRNASVTVCDPEPVRDSYGYNRVNDGRVAGYDVTYEYAGRTHRTHTDYHPGDRIRVRVDVRPE